MYMPSRQLAVVEGLVQDRIQRIKGGTGVLETRCAPVSYGMICSVEYDPQKHLGEEVEIDRLDRKKWAKNQIRWLITQACLPSHSTPNPFVLTLFNLLGKPSPGFWRREAIPFYHRPQ